MLVLFGIGFVVLVPVLVSCFVGIRWSRVCCSFRIPTVRCRLVGGGVLVGFGS